MSCSPRHRERPDIHGRISAELEIHVRARVQAGCWAHTKLRHTKCGSRPSDQERRDYATCGTLSVYAKKFSTCVTFRVLRTRSFTPASVTEWPSFWWRT